MFIRKRKQAFPVVKHEKIHLKSKLDDLINGAYRLEKEGISQSLLSNWTCRVKFLLSCQGLLPVDSGKGTHYGSICHDVLEKIYKDKKMLTKKEIDKIIDLFILKNQKKLSWNDREIEQLAAISRTVMLQYCKVYESDLKLMNIVETEKIFGQYIDRLSANALIKGKRDLLFSYVKDADTLYYMEHKTMGSVNEKVLKARLPIDKQNLFYLMSLLGEGRRVNNVIYNIIRKPQIKRTEWESIVDFCKRLDSDINDRPEFYFLRYPVYYSSSDIEDYRRQLILKFREIDMFTKGKLSIYRNESSCESAYNGTPFTCEYIDVCQSNDVSSLVKNDLFSELK